MGQKVHPEILKLSKTAGWKSKYIERKKINLGLHAGKDLEVRTFIKQFFTGIGFDIHNCKISYFNQRLNIQISYTKNNKLLQGVQLFATAQKTNSKPRKIELREKSLKVKIKKLFFIFLLYSANTAVTNPSNITEFFIQNAEKKHLQFLNTQSLSRKLFIQLVLQKVEKLIPAYYNTPFVCYNPNSAKIFKKDLLNKVYFNLTKVALQKTILLIIKSLGVINLMIKNKVYQSYKRENVCKYTFTTLFCKIFSLFFKKPLKMTLIFKALNQNVKKARPKQIKNILRKKIFLLRRYKRNKFFKKGLNLMILLISKKESANALASYIAFTLKNFKKHKLFLKFMKQTLSLFLKQKKPVVQALKIQLKGRINGADRARHYVIKVGNQLSLLTTSSRINYSENTIFTPDGTLSVKVWIKYRKGLTQLKSKRRSHKVIKL